MTSLLAEGITYFTCELDTPKHHSKCDIFYTDISATTVLFYFIIFPIAVDKAFYHYILTPSIGVTISTAVPTPLIS
jgi:hypothetical protein